MGHYSILESWRSWTFSATGKDNIYFLSFMTFLCGDLIHEADLSHKEHMDG